VTRVISQERIQESTFATSSMGKERPTDLDIAFEPVSIKVNKRVLKASLFIVTGGGPLPRSTSASDHLSLADCGRKGC
jgi:hypothetical protein